MCIGEVCFLFFWWMGHKLRFFRFNGVPSVNGDSEEVEE